MEIYKKLLKIQKAVKGLSKDKQSHQYGYVTGNKLLSFIKPLMDEYGLLLKQEILSIENERQDYKTKYGEKSEILTKVMMQFTWIDTDTGETDVNLFGANGQNDWEKGLGSALTYGERYFLLKYFHIATDQDDIDNPDRKTSEPVEITPETTAQPIDFDRLKTRLEACTSLDQLKKVYTSFTPQEKTITKDVTNTMKALLTPTQNG